MLPVGTQLLGAALREAMAHGPSARYQILVSAPWPCVQVQEASGVYQQRRPEQTSFYRLIDEHFEEYLRCHEERFEPRDGHLRPHVRQVVEQYLDCPKLPAGLGSAGPSRSTSRP